MATEPVDGRQIDFTFLKEGMMYEKQGKKIRHLIFQHKKFIVYIDDENFVQWDESADYGEYVDFYGEVSNRVAELESLKLPKAIKKDESLIFNFKRMVAEGMVRMLDKFNESSPPTGNVSAMSSKHSLEILAQAARFISAQLDDWARKRLVFGAFIAFLAVLVAGELVYLHMVCWKLFHCLDDSAHFMFMGACAGGVGAFFSMLLRIDAIPVDSNSSWLHYKGAFRILYGALGAYLISLGINAGFIFELSSRNSPEAAMLFLCFVAGASERLVPEVITKVESLASKRS